MKRNNQKKKQATENQRKKKKRKDDDFVDKKDIEIQDDEDAFQPEEAIIFDLNEESHENQVTIVRQKHLNSAYVSIEKLFDQLKTIRTDQGEIPLDKFDALNGHDAAIALRNDLNFIVAPYEKAD